ncbi:unnamed protein product, partial [marine sediment metagenome]
MSRYKQHERKSETVPLFCPLLKTCRQRMADLEEYERLKNKWTGYAKKQDEKAAEVRGSQIFYLEYKQGANERLEKMCPHVKREALGLFTKEPPYLQCQLFS